MMVFQYLSIKHKLVVIILFVSFVVVACGFSIIIYNDIKIFKKDLFETSELNAKLISEYSKGPLSFGDKEMAEEILAKIENISWVLNAHLYDKNNVYFMSYNKNNVGEFLYPKEKTEYTILKDGYLHIYRPIIQKNEYLGSLYIRATVEPLTEKINQYLYTVITVMVGLFLFAYFLAVKMQKFISDPVLNLADVTKQISERDDYTVRVIKTGEDEIGSLYDNFNNMIESIERRKFERDRALVSLQESEKKIRAVFNQSFQLFALLDTDGKILEINQPSFEIFLYRVEDLSGQNLYDVLWWEKSPRQKLKLQNSIINAASGEVSRYEIIYQKNNEQRYIDFSLKPIIKDFKKINYILAEAHDITGIKKAEEQVRNLNLELEERVDERTKQLENANSELEAFSYSVSHDLRAPLRSINGFSQVLLEDYYNNLDYEGQEYIRRVRRASQRMSDLIDEMLKLSKITRIELQKKDLDLSKIAEDIFNDLKMNEPSLKIDIIIEKKLFTRGDEKLIGIMLNNLINNAVKFTRNKPEPKIEIGLLKEKMIADVRYENLFYIRDNGAGFDMNYAEKLFGAFQRLHLDSEFEGNGVGLAIVKRIINKHGGHIWAEGIINEGAVFYFII